ncbi:MAG: alpha/beta hydrolase, partial [Deltaproteobacteria bacterium]
MEEERLYFQCGDLRLEGLLGDADSSRGVVITHPHPLYGGDMHNNIVDAIRWAYHRNGYTTLRFNFRGVGTSHGSYDDGIGEQDDISAAINFLIGKGCREIHLAGYSFGAWVISKGLPRYEQVVQVVMVSPPAAFLEFSFNGPEPRIGLVITGSHDDIAPPSLAKKLLEQWNPDAELKIV